MLTSSRLRELLKWEAKIMIAGKTINLGRFDDIQDAALAYAKAARKYFGEFARAL